MPVKQRKDFCHRTTEQMKKKNVVPKPTAVLILFEWATRIYVKMADLFIWIAI
jgi:hypothetical protein